MPGGYYTALSGMRTRLDRLDRIASDIANASTAGYKSERAATEEALRPAFGAALQSAIDVTSGPAKVDLRPGAISPTGRDLDLALEGNGFFVVQTAAGLRYTRNGQFTRASDGTLVTADGDAVQGAAGAIRIAAGRIAIEPDGTVRAGATVAGRLRIVELPPGATLVREDGARFRVDGAQPADATNTTVRSGALEQSNASVVDRIAELTDVTRSFATLQRAISLLMNDVDGRAIVELGRK